MDREMLNLLYGWALGSGKTELGYEHIKYWLDKSWKEQREQEQLDNCGRVLKSYEETPLHILIRRRYEV